MLKRLNRSSQEHKDIAAVIIEPVVGNMGCVPPRAGYLEAVRKISKEHGALLIFDEVMTGFRIARGGAQERYGITPDITTLGKIIGGGLPVGAYGGSREIMSQIAPAGPIYQAGTLSGNPLSMTAGLVTLRRLRDKSVYEQLESATQSTHRGSFSAQRRKQESPPSQTASVRCGPAFSVVNRSSTGTAQTSVTGNSMASSFTRC